MKPASELSDAGRLVRQGVSSTVGQPCANETSTSCARSSRRGDGFGHEEHLELSWRYLQMYEAERAQRVVASATRQVASAHGAPEKYHETLTPWWVHLVALHRAKSDAKSFE